MNNQIIEAVFKKQGQFKNMFVAQSVKIHINQ